METMRNVLGCMPTAFPGATPEEVSLRRDWGHKLLSATAGLVGSPRAKAALQSALLTSLRPAASKKAELRSATMAQLALGEAGQDAKAQQELEEARQTKANAEEAAKPRKRQRRNVLTEEEKAIRRRKSQATYREQKKKQQEDEGAQSPGSHDDMAEELPSARPLEESVVAPLRDWSPASFRIPVMDAEGGDGLPKETQDGADLERNGGPGGDPQGAEEDDGPPQDTQGGEDLGQMKGGSKRARMSEAEKAASRKAANAKSYQKKKLKRASVAAPPVLPPTAPPFDGPDASSDASSGGLKRFRKKNVAI